MSSTRREFRAAQPDPSPHWLEHRGALLLAPAELVEIGLEYAPAGLISSRARSGLSKLGSDWPPCFSFGCFELHLAGTGRVDFLASAITLDGARRYLRRKLKSGRSTHLKRVPDPNAPSRALLGHWARTRTAGLRRVRDVWLEWDIAGQVPAAPFAFVRLQQGASAVDAAAVVQLLRRQFGLEQRPKNQPSLRADLTRCAETLGPILHVAVMPGRGTNDVRIHVGADRRLLPQRLARLGWPGDHSAVTDVLSLWHHSPRTIGVQLQLGDAWRPSLGLEYFRETPAGCDLRLRRLLRGMQQRGLLQGAQVEALESWVASDHAERPAERWYLRVVRRLQLKIGLSDSGELRAKAYLGFSPRYSAI